MLDSTKPLWQSELKGCVVQNNSPHLIWYMEQPIYPNFKDQPNTTKEENNSLKIVIKKDVCLKPGCTKLVQVPVDGEVADLFLVNWCEFLTSIYNAKL